MRFNSTISEGLDQDRSLDAYLDALSDGQDKIYYLIAESPTSARNSPHLESLRERGIEVLLLADRVDEWVMQHLTEFKGKSFKDIGRGDLELDDENDTKIVEAEPTKKEKEVLKRIKRLLKDKVDEVRISSRLKESASCLVLGEQDLSFQMRQMLKASGHETPDSMPSLELNPNHLLVRQLMEKEEDEQFESLSWILLEQAFLIEGRPLEDPVLFVQRVNDLIAK